MQASVKVLYIHNAELVADRLWRAGYKILIGKLVGTIKGSHKKQPFYDQTGQLFVIFYKKLSLSTTRFLLNTVAAALSQNDWIAVKPWR